MEKTSAEYIQYLREALVIDPSIKKGIELLLQDVQEKLVSPEQREFSSLKKQVQEPSKMLLGSGDLQTAKSFDSRIRRNSRFRCSYMFLRKALFL